MFGGERVSGGRAANAKEKESRTTFNKVCVQGHGIKRGKEGAPQ